MQRGATSGRLVALVVVYGLLLCARPSLAQPAASDEPPCVVQLMPPDVAGEWRRASSELSHRIRRWPAADRDCRELLVEVQDDGALITITTKDGRRARRLVATPSALVPAASALAVSVETHPPNASVEAPAAQPAKEPERPVDRFGLLVLAGGVRVGTPGVFWAPVIRGAAALQLNRWELGTFVDWAPEHWLAADEVPPRFTMWSMSSGLTAGRREPLGAVDFLAGVMFGATFVHQKSTTEEVDDDMVEIDEEQGAGVDLLLGGYVGVATPRHKSVRFRAQLELALPPSHPGQTRELDSDLPPLPGWSLTALVGAEFGAP